jgi:hypothetical protein
LFHRYFALSQGRYSMISLDTLLLHGMLNKYRRESDLGERVNKIGEQPERLVETGREG